MDFVQSKIVLRDDDVYTLCEVVLTGKFKYHCQRVTCYDARGRACLAYYGNYCKMNSHKLGMFGLTLAEWYTRPNMFVVYLRSRIFGRSKSLDNNNKEQSQIICVLGEKRLNHYLSWLAHEALKDWESFSKIDKSVYAKPKLIGKYMSIKDLETDPWALYKKEHVKRESLPEMRMSNKKGESLLWNF
jgi:hypothetical protein